jgi:RimJ/RimL family protein N-acetyltransferase
VPVHPPEEIALPNGTLRRLREADCEQIALAVRASLDHLRPWMTWASEDAAEPDRQAERGREAEQLWADGSDHIYTLRPSDADMVIGTFGLHRRVGPRAVEIGYWVHAGYVGRGHATAAVRALTSAVLALDDVERIEIHTDQANGASAAIPRRLGYRLDRVEVRAPTAPAESGRLQIWVIVAG